MKNKKAIYEEIQNLITTFCVFFLLCGSVAITYMYLTITFPSFLALYELSSLNPNRL